MIEVGEAFGGLLRHLRAAVRRVHRRHGRGPDARRAAVAVRRPRRDAARRPLRDDGVRQLGRGRQRRRSRAGRTALLDVGVERPTDRIAGWRAALASSPTGAEPFDEAYRRLQALVAYSPEERHLIHSDLLHFNVLVSDDRITGIFDWGCGLYGDFLYDLAWFCFWSPWYTAWQGIDFRQEALRHYATIGLDVPHFEERLLACEIHIGLGGQAYQAYKGYWPEMAWTARTAPWTWSGHGADVDFARHDPRGRASV